MTSKGASATCTFRIVSYDPVGKPNAGHQGSNEIGWARHVGVRWCKLLHGVTCFSSSLNHVGVYWNRVRIPSLTPGNCRHRLNMIKHEQPTNIFLS